MKAYLLISTENSSLITGTTNNFYCFQQHRIPANKHEKLKIKSQNFYTFSMLTCDSQAAACIPIFYILYLLCSNYKLVSPLGHQHLICRQNYINTGLKTVYASIGSSSCLKDTQHHHCKAQVQLSSVTQTS